MALLKLIKSSPVSARIGFVIIVANFLACLLAPVIAPYSETEIAGDVWETPNSNHIMGTDQLGRDMATRILYGARNTVSIALVITLWSRKASACQPTPTGQFIGTAVITSVTSIRMSPDSTAGGMYRAWICCIGGTTNPG